MTKLGADIQQLNALGKALQRQGANLRSCEPTITAALNQVRWTGPDAQAFRNAWATKHAPALKRAASRIDELGTTTIGQAAQQAEASGGGSGPSSNQSATSQSSGGERILEGLGEFPENVNEWIATNGPISAELSKLSTSELMATLNDSNTDDTHRAVAQALLRQQLSQINSEELDGPSSANRGAQRATELTELAQRLDEPQSYEGRSADERRYKALTTQLFSEQLRTAGELTFDMEKRRFEQYYNEAGPEQQQALSTQKLLFEAETERREKLSKVAAEASTKTKQLVGSSPIPAEVETREQVAAQVHAVLKGGGEPALARFADQLNTVADRTYGSKLNRVLQSLPNTSEGSALVDRLHASIDSTDRNLFDHVAEPPSFANIVGRPVLSTALDLWPPTGIAKGIVQAVVGIDVVTFEDLSWGDRGLGLAGSGLGVLGDLAKSGKVGGGLVDALVSDEVDLILKVNDLGQKLIQTVADDEGSNNEENSQ